MRILIVTFYFPPYNAIGAVRVGKIAKYLFRKGHDVRVITAKNIISDVSLKVEIPLDNVIYANWPSKFYESRIFRNLSVAAIPTKSSNWSSVVSVIKRTVKSILFFPDKANSWIPYAVQSGNELLRRWKPDVIYASGGPFSSFIVATILSKKARVPWIAEYRDLWSNNHYADLEYLNQRMHIDRILESLIVRDARAIVTVSQGLAEKLRLLFDKPIFVVYNGFDPEDYPVSRDFVDKREILKIGYFGTLYSLRRDPTTLFVAIQKLKSKGLNIRVDFYGPDVNILKGLIKQFNLESFVQIHAPIGYKSALAKMRSYDLLLLLLLNDPREKGVLTGKIFEYLGAGRPILAIGPEDCEAAHIIRGSSAGLISSNPEEIASYLEYFYENRESLLNRFDVNKNVINFFTREIQTNILLEYISALIK
ncbi:MAG: glycosyltransferase [Nitrososphaeria archaeon]